MSTRPLLTALGFSLPVVLLSVLAPMQAIPLFWYWLPLHIAVWYGSLQQGTVIALLLVLASTAFGSPGSLSMFIRLLLCAGTIALVHHRHHSSAR